jgi:hypothetical protein
MTLLRVLFCAAVAELALVLSGCTPDMAGATTETTNGVVGTVYNDDNTPAGNTIVKLLPSDYNPLDEDAREREHIDTTDTSGRYQFNRISTGTYTVLGRKRSNTTSFLTRGVFVHEDSVTEVPGGVLNQSGSIVADFSGSANAASGYVFIPGTDIAAPVAHDGSMVLDDVPSGSVDTVLFVSSTVESFNILRSELTVSADSTVSIDQPLWRHQQRLILNTSSSGAKIQSDVYGFPVLVRLDSSNLQFSRTGPDGKDLLFTKENGAPIPFEVERWDADAQHAEVWVRIDTVFGNDSTQSLLMYWGNELAVASAGSRSVFDTSAGFLGVWHLGDKGTDATQGKNNAVVCTPRDTVGMIGLGKKFSGKDSIKIPTMFGMPQVVTLSAWARLDSVVSGAKGAEIVSIADGCLLRMDDTEADTFGVSGSFHLEGETSFHHVCSGRFLENTGWHHCVVAFDCRSKVQTLYIDGAMSGRTTVADTMDYSEVGVATLIGIHGNGKASYQFIGVIDEVRIRGMVVSEDVVKLEYMNQKTDDALVKFD